MTGHYSIVTCRAMRVSLMQRFTAVDADGVSFPGIYVMAQVDLILVIACRCRKLSGISQRQGLATRRPFNGPGNRGIHTDAYKVDNRNRNAFLWTRQLISTDGLGVSFQPQRFVGYASPYIGLGNKHRKVRHRRRS